jgi:hypothetical protein
MPGEITRRNARFTRAQACAPDFGARFARACPGATPLMQFLTGAVGLRW